MLSGLACPGPRGVSTGAGPVWVLLLSVYTLAAVGDSSPSRHSLPHSVNRSGASHARLAFIQPDGRGRGVSDFALLSFTLSPFSLVYPPLSSAFRPIFSVILSSCLSVTLFLSFFFYSISARLTWAGAPLCVFIAGFSPGRVVRCSCPPFRAGARVYNAVFALYTRGAVRAW